MKSIVAATPGGTTTNAAKTPLPSNLTITDPSRVFSWRKLVPTGGTAPKHRFGHSMTLIRKKLIIFGGGSESYHDGVGCLNVDTLRWQQIDASGIEPVKRANHSATRVGSKLIVFGGTGYNITNHIHILDTEKWTWSEVESKGDSPSIRTQHTITWIDSKRLILFGGMEKDQLPRDNSVYVFTFDNVEAEEPTDLTQSTYSVGRLTQSFEDVTSSAGPSQQQQSSSTPVTPEFDGVWSKAEVKGTPPPPLAGHSAVLFQKKILFFGGITAKGVSRDLFELDIDTFTWKKFDIDPNRWPPPLYQHTAVATTDGRMLLFGGKALDVNKGEYCTNAVYAYHLETTHWVGKGIHIGTKTASIPQPRFGHTAAFVGGRMFVWGGKGNSQTKATVFYDDLWCLETSTPPAPQSLSHRKIGCNAIDLVWTPPSTGPSGVDKYKLECSKDGGETWETVFKGKAPSFLVQDLLPETTYKFRISSSNSLGWGEWRSADVATAAYSPSLVISGSLLSGLRRGSLGSSPVLPGVTHPLATSTTSTDSTSTTNTTKRSRKKRKSKNKDGAASATTSDVSDETYRALQQENERLLKRVKDLEQQNKQLTAKLGSQPASTRGRSPAKKKRKNQKEKSPDGSAKKHQIHPPTGPTSPRAQQPQQAQPKQQPPPIASSKSPSFPPQPQPKPTKQQPAAGSANPTPAPKPQPKPTLNVKPNIPTVKSHPPKQSQPKVQPKLPSIQPKITSINGQ